MAKKKKNKKKGSLQLNPHKLSEKEIVHKIREDTSSKNIDQTYKLVKILIQRFDCDENRQLFKSILDQRVFKLLEEKKINAAETLVEAGKKQFPHELFRDAEKQLKLIGLSPSELLEEYQSQEEIPEIYKYEFADTLFFSKNINKAFIKKHKEYKDLFYVKEAFAQGYDPIKTKNLMTPVNSSSPFKYWLLLRKGIEAFFEGDIVTLQSILDKIRHSTFPQFLLKKLIECQHYLEQGLENSINLSAEDAAVLTVLLGEKFPEQLLLKRLRYLINKKEFETSWKILKKASLRIDSDIYNVLFILISASYFEMDKRAFNPNRFQNKLASFPRMEGFYLNRDHLFFKLLPASLFPDEFAELVLKKVLSSKELKKCKLFESNLLGAELYYYLAKNIDPELSSRHKNVMSPGSHSFMNLSDGFEDINLEITEYLENSLSLSQHNSGIFIALINHLVRNKAKTSTINHVVKRLIARFPENYEGYQLAGDIALRNKTYQKAIDYYHQAFHLMPLNRELVLTIIQCFSNIILQRTRSKAHLIKKDISKAEVYTHTSHKTIQLELCLLKTLAFCCQVKLEGEKEIRFDEINKLYSGVREDPPSSFRFFSQLEELLDQKQLNSHFKEERANLVKNLSTSDFSKITDRFFESNQDTPCNLWFESLEPFLKNEKRAPALPLNHLIRWVYLSLKKKFYNAFKTLIYLGYHNYPKDFRWAFLAEIIKEAPASKKVLKFLCHKSTLDWLFTEQGFDLLKELFQYDYNVSALFYIIEGIKEYGIRSEIPYKEIEDEFTQLLHHHIDPFISFRRDIVNSISPLDKTPMGKINKLFKLSTKGNKKKSLKTQSGAVPLRADSPQQRSEINSNDQLNFFDLLDN